MRASIDGTPCRFLADCMRSEPHTNCRRRRFKRLSRLSSMPLPTARSQLGDGLCGFSDRSAHLTMSRYYNASLQPTATLVRGSRFGKRPSRRSRPSAKESKIPKSRGLRYRRSQVVPNPVQLGQSKQRSSKLAKTASYNYRWGCEITSKQGIADPRSSSTWNPVSSS